MGKNVDILASYLNKLIFDPHDQTNKIACVPSQDSDQSNPILVHVHKASSKASSKNINTVYFPDIKIPLLIKAKTISNTFLL